jgi:hypothetical protein
MIPDVVYGLLTTNVHTYSNTKSSLVVGEMTAKATFVFDVNHGAVVNMGSAEVDSSSLSNFMLYDGSEEELIVGSKRGLYFIDNPSLDSSAAQHEVNMSNINTSEVERYLSNARLLTPPVRICLDCRLIMHLNSEKRIEKMEYQLKPSKEKRVNVMYN